MAKELPYFKFEPNQWENGNIQYFSREVKGLFVDLCSMYWSRLGDLDYALALQKLCNGITNEFDLLMQRDIFTVEDDKIIIEFLDEQLNEFQETSEKRRQSANKRWKNKGKNANALQMQSKSNAIREDKIREDKILNYIPKNQDFQAEVENQKAVLYFSDKNGDLYDSDFKPLNKKINADLIITSKKEKEKSSVKKENGFTQEVYDCYDGCIGYFDKELLPTTSKDLDNWMDTIEKLNRLDHLSFDDILHIVKSARGDAFWSKNFLSLAKLRRKDKDNIPYWRIFAEKFKQKPTKSENTYNAYEEARKMMNL